MSTPAVRAASRSDVPSATDTGLPSIVRLIVLTSAISEAMYSSLGEACASQPSGCGGRAERTALAVDVRLEFVAPFLDAGHNGNRARIREHADRLPRHGIADLEQRVEVFHGALTRLDALHDLRRPCRAF